jgi:CP family cyanate transporter-like MFS transporter
MPHRYSKILEIVAIVLIALNLRPFLAGPGPVLDQIGADTGLGLSWLSTLALGPLALIGLGALAAPAIQTRAGARPTIWIALVLIAVGCAVRIVPQGGVVIATAVVCGAGVALLQAVMPALIRERFAQRYSLVTSLYSACLLAGGALGAQAVPLIAQAVRLGHGASGYGRARHTGAGHSATGTWSDHAAGR